MTPHRALNIALALAIAAIMSCSYLLDGPSDTQHADDVAADVLDATHTALVAAK